MTMHTKAATDDIYEIFNQPLKVAHNGDESADDDDYETDDYTGYTSGAESTGTTRNISTSEAGDEDAVENEVDEEGSDAKSVSEWSDFTARKHIPDVLREGEQDDTQASNRFDGADPEPSVLVSEPAEDEEGEEDDDEVLTPVSEYSLPGTRTSFIPIPPEDYVPPMRPYRDPVEVANNRLPFMTPITERTESSLDIEAGDESVHSKTPCRREDKTALSEDEEEDTLDLEALSSPLREVVNDDLPKGRITQPFLQKSTASVSKPLAAKGAPKGPIIKDVQCNPMDDSVRDEILANLQPPLSSYEGFFDHRDEKYEKGAEIRKSSKALSKNNRNSTDKTGNLSASVMVQFSDTTTQYAIKKELGAGAFAPVYLVENSSHAGADEDEEVAQAAMGRGAFACAHNRRSALEALKMEQPPTPWEFHMMRLAHTRLGPQHRATASLSAALEMHLYQDDGFLILPYHPHGTLLDIVNLFRADPSGVMDEQLAMFFSIELFRTVEALHAKQILHGDLKADNCLLRLDQLQAPAGGDSDLSTQWSRSGAGGWATRGITLIDFGRGIDMRCFAPEAQFVADWKTTAQDCAEMREGRPWTWQVDYHGLAGTVHVLLFGKYIETARCDAGGLGTAGGRRYKIRESLKRYWQTEIWAECFDVLLNPGAFVEAEEGARMPVLRSMRRVRERMEECLEASCERGVGLRALMGRVEAWAKARR
jgi:checkpoint serine/threonine-protein kinase